VSRCFSALPSGCRPGFQHTAANGTLKRPHGTEAGHAAAGQDTVGKLGRRGENRSTPNGLRHTHAAALVAEGVPVNVIQAQLVMSACAPPDVYLRHIAPAQVLAPVRPPGMGRCSAVASGMTGSLRSTGSGRAGAR
jgi:integrase